MTSETVPSSPGTCCLIQAIRRPRGRPRQLSEEERRQRLMDTAVSVFLDLGYDAASMDEIAHRAGMSKRTVYQVFKSKDELFVATLLAGCGLSLDEMNLECGATTAAGLEEALVAHMMRVAEVVLSPERVALSRILMSEGRRPTAVGHMFDAELFQRGPMPLAGWIQNQMDRGVLRPGDAREVASMLFGMTLSEAHMRLIVGVPASEVADPERLKGRVTRGVRLFLTGALVSP